jgi:uncharacterized membrane protein YdjX (TVP38/TMEM64 family)
VTEVEIRTTPANDAQGASPEWRGVVIKNMVVAVVLLGAMALVYLTPLRSVLTHAREISLHLKEMGWIAPAAATMGVAALTAIGCFRLPLCAVCGMAFGFWWGILWAQLGTLIGYYGTFLFVRWGGGGFAAAKWPRIERLAHQISSGGVWTVVLVRQMPVAGFYVNILLGLLPVGHGAYLVGTLFGTLPEAIPLTLIGAGALESTFGGATAYLAMAVACFVAAGLALKRYLRSSALPATGDILGSPMERPADELPQR